MRAIILTLSIMTLVACSDSVGTGPGGGADGIGGGDGSVLDPLSGAQDDVGPQDIAQKEVVPSPDTASPEEVMAPEDVWPDASLEEVMAPEDVWPDASPEEVTAPEDVWPDASLEEVMAPEDVWFDASLEEVMAPEDVWFDASLEEVMAPEDVWSDADGIGPSSDAAMAPDSEAPVEPTVRSLFPMSTARSTSNRPLFRVAITGVVDGAQITVCAQLSCDDVLLVFSISGTEGPASEPLPAGPVYWYAEGLADGVVITPPTPTWQLHVPAHPALVGTAWGTTFDLELDGYADVLVGSCGLSGCEQLVGIHGGSELGPSELATAIILGPPEATSFGFSVTSAGDVNGDGLPDVIVGAGLGDSAHVFLNSPDGLLPEPVQSWVVPGAWFGFSVSGAGDVNGDGYGDVIVGALLGFSAFVYYGGPEGPGGGPNKVLSSGAFGFGVSVGTVGDVNGDGYEDLGIGAANGTPAEMTVWYGGPDGPGELPGAVVYGDEGGLFGTSVRSAGDVNRDGYADVIVGDPDLQVVAIHHGGPDGLVLEPATVVTDVTSVEGFGISVAGAGDVNGDGYGDVVVGGSDDDVDFAYVYLGSATGVLPEPHVILVGPLVSQFGDSVACLGDVNDDGFDDIGIGATNAVRAFAYFGGPDGISEEPSVTLLPDPVGADELANTGYGFTVGHSTR